MADDEMRLRAVVVDQYTAPLKKLRDDLKAAGGANPAKDIAHDWKGVRNEIGSVTRDLNTVMAPTLRGLGITSIGVGAAITGMFIGLKNTAEAGRNVKYLSEQLDVSANKLREIQALGEHFDIGGSQVASSLKSLQENLNELTRNWGNAYNQLRGMNLGWMAKDIQEAAKRGGIGEAFETILKDLQKIPDPVYRRQIAQLLLGADQWAVVADQQTRRLRDKIKEQVGTVTPEQLAAEEALVSSLKETNRLIDELWQHSTPLINLFNRGLQGLNDLLGKLGNSGLDMFTGGDPEDRRRWLALQLSAKQGKLKGVEEDIAAFRGRGYRDENALLRFSESQRNRLTDEIAKLRNELEELNKKAADPLHKSSFFGGGIGGGMPRVMQVSYSGGMGGSGGLGGRYRRAAGGGIAIPDNAGAGLQSSEYLAARRSGMRAEIEKDPLLKQQIAGMLSLEGTPIETMESLANRTEYVNSERSRRGQKPLSLREMLFSGFYGPINRGQLPAAMRRLQANPRLMQRYFDAVDAVMRGSNTVKGATDQGMPSDPNGMWAGGGFRLRRGGNVFNDWGGGPGGHAGAQRFREEQQRRVIEGAPPAADLLPKPVPLPQPNPQRVEGAATLHVRFDNAPAGMRTQLATEGMFRDVRITRMNRQATQASDYVA